jgi:nuclear cap-binding protein subunit 1
LSLIVDDLLAKLKSPENEIEQLMDDLKTWYNEKYNEGSMEEGAVTGEDQSFAHEVLFHCVLQLGSKSFSHLLNVIEKNIDFLRSVNESDTARYSTILAAAEFWKGNSQFLEITLAKFMNYGILDAKSIIMWALSSNVLSKDYSR